MSSAATGSRAGNSLRCVAVLPARLDSTRLARKMLLAETGTPLIVHSARNVATCPAIQRVVVATDSEEVRAACEVEGVEALLTSPAHASGTDRVQEALAALGAEWDVVLNVQGDEPDVDSADLARLVAAFADDAVELATLCGPVGAVDFERSSVVKVVRDGRGDALYFSRAPIPAAAHARSASGADNAGRAPARHVGVYAFRPAALAQFCELGPSPLERTENLEQLRWLEAGRSIRVLEVQHVPRGIDTREDYEAFVKRTRHCPAQSES